MDHNPADDTQADDERDDSFELSDEAFERQRQERSRKVTALLGLPPSQNTNDFDFDCHVEKQ